MVKTVNITLLSSSYIQHCAVWHLQLRSFQLNQYVNSKAMEFVCAFGCVCTHTRHLPAHLTNHTEGLFVIIVTHVGFSKSLQLDYKAIWCWVDCVVALIINIHTEPWLILYLFLPSVPFAPTDTKKCMP